MNFHLLPITAHSNINLCNELKTTPNIILNMKLSARDAENIVRDFPSVELSYEKKIHKKVPFHNVVLTIPKGKKFFVWFRVYKRNNVCFFLELDRYRKRIKNITIQRCCFSSELCMNKGTIIYGTKFNHHSGNFFNVEDILFFKNRNLNNHTPLKRLLYIIDFISTYTKQVSYSPHEIIFGLPLMERNKQSLLKKLETVPYPLYSIQYRTLDRRTPFCNECVFQKLDYEKIFLVRAAIEDDIYDLYAYSQAKKVIKHTSAIVPDVKTSVWMNSLFRNIKENSNLDALEESDDEEEFENIELDKYVDLNKEYKMKCVYIPKFRSWKPKEICEDGIISSINEIMRIEKNNN